MDFQELAAWLGMRSSQANFPCPKCLVPKDFLSKLTQRFEHRNTASMRNIIEDARGQQTKRDKEEILRGAGLHDVEVSFQFLCPRFLTQIFSKYCGNSGVPIRTKPFLTTPSTGMTAGSLVDIFGFIRNKS
jgi:hypothetical protein